MAAVGVESGLEHGHWAACAEAVVEVEHDEDARRSEATFGNGLPCLSWCRQLGAAIKVSAPGSFDE